MEFTTITSAVTAAGGMIVTLIGDAVDLIVSHPLLLLPIGVTFVGIGYNYASRFIRV